MNFSCNIANRIPILFGVMAENETRSAFTIYLQKGHLLYHPQSLLTFGIRHLD